MSIPFNDEDLKIAAKNLIDTKIGPIIAQDGGAIVLLDVVQGKIYIQLQGACVGCGSSGTTLKFVVEKNLKEFIHPDLQIINVPHGMEEKVPNVQEN